MIEHKGIQFMCIKSSAVKISCLEMGFEFTLLCYYVYIHGIVCVHVTALR